MENNNKEEKREFYVYKHIRKDNNTCFYVGKGKLNRCYDLSRNPHHDSICEACGCYVVKIKENLTEEEAFALEREIIEDYVFVFGYGINIKGYDDYDHNLPHLTNFTWGGEGTSGMNAFANKTPEEMEEIGNKISEKSKGRNSYAGKTPEEMEIIAKKKSKALKGKSLYANKTPEEIEEIRRKKSEKVSGEKNGMFGKKGEKNPMFGKNAFENKTPEEMEEIRRKMGESHSKKVICITTGKTFDCIKDAGDWYNVSRGNISLCCRGKIQSAGKLNGTKLQWKYVEDYNN